MIMRERWEGEESPSAYVDHCLRRVIFCLTSVFFPAAFPRSGCLSPGGVGSHYMMRVRG